MATKKRRELVDPKKLFRFKTFSERLATINIDVAHRVGIARDGPEGCATFFSEGLQKWRELNCSEDFVHFSKEVSHLSQSLPQLIHHKDTVVEVLERYLLKRNPLALEPLLDLLIQLARDVQSDLHPHFGHLFVTLASLLHTQDATCIEQVFTCLAYLLKFLWRPLSRDIHNTFCVYADLLGSQQRAHIRKFAAESFAYLMRKVHNLPVLFELMFQSVQNDSELTEGVGLLLFEMCKGVQKQFHSCTHQVLPLLLSMLGPVLLTEESTTSTQLYHKEVFSCLQVLMQSMAEYTRKEYAAVVWDILTGAALRVARSVNGSECGSYDQLKSILHLLGIWVSWRNGSRLMANTRPLFELMVQLLQEDHYPHDLEHTLLLLCASFLLVHHATSNQDARQLVKLVLSKTHVPQLVLSFTRQLYGWPAFRQVLLPEVAPFCELALSACHENREVVLLFATEVVLQTSSHWEVHPAPSDEGSEGNGGGGRCKGDSTGIASSEVSLSNSLDTNGSDSLLVGILKDTIRAAVSNLTTGHVAMSEAQATWCALVCSPCCSPHDSGLRDLQVELVRTLLSLLLGGSDEQSMDNVSVPLFLLGHALNSLSLVAADGRELLQAADLDSIVQLLKVHGSNVCVLGGAHNFLKTCIALCKERLTDVLPVLLGNLTSSYSQVRLMTLRILCLFDPLPCSDGVPCSLLATCLQVEQLPADLQHIRSKVMRLQALKYSSDQLKLLPDAYHQVSLRYLLGSFYVNFSPLWSPVMELVSSYAVNNCKAVFWDVYTGVMEQVTRSAETCSPPSAVPQPDKPASVDRISDLFLFHFSVSQWASNDGRADHVNCRLLLWRTLEKFPEFAESRSKVLVPIFLRFVDREVTLWEESLMQHQSIHREGAGITQGVDSEEYGVTMEGVERGGDKAESGEEALTREGGEEDMEDDGTERVLGDGGERMEELKSSSSETVGKETGKARSTMRTLKQILSVFCLFTNPKVLHRQQDLHSLYTSLLLHRDPGVQGLALKCLFTYKSSSIIPYREHLERLLNDATFTEELLSFSSVSDLYIVKPEHQAELIPVLIRVLYGRIQRFGHPKPAAQRRGAVLRFLEACKGGEVEEFVRLISAPFEHVTHCSGSSKEVIPLKKQQGFLHLVLHLLPALRDQMLPHLSKLLHIVLQLAKQASELLDTRQTIIPRFVSLMRDIRALGIQVVREVFVTFPDWDCADTQYLFQCVVLPQLARLPQEAIQSPTPLLLLLHTWTCHTQLHKFFLHPVPLNGGSEADSVMGYVYPCLFAKGATPKVIDVVIEMTENLLQDSSMLSQQQECEMTPEQRLPLGCRVVVPHVKALLKYVAMAVEGRLGQHAARKSLSRELSMLSRISLFVTESSVAVQLVQLVLPFLGRTALASRYQSSEVAVLQTCRNLIVHCDPEQFVQRFDVLFCTLSQPSSRQELCHVYHELTKKAKKYQPVADIVCQLNAWNPRRVDEPDYNARIEGFCAGKRLLSTEQIEVEVILPILNNALFYVLTSDDLSIRDSAVSYIIHVVSHLSQLAMDEHSSLLSVVLRTLMPGVILGMKSKSDVAHHEFIAILGQLARSFKDHPRFKELAVLTDPDPEADFFENMRHIQVHRRARALRKLQGLIQGGSFSHTSIVSYFLPMITHVIFNTVSQKDHNLLSAAVEALGAVATRLKWSAYRYTLMKNVRLLSQKSSMQKVLIRVIVAVLNSFHFDVGAAAPGLAGGPPESDPSKDDAMDLEGGAVEEGVVKNADELDDDDAVLNGDGDGEQKESMDSAVTVQKIHDSICTSVLPELQECLVKRGEMFGHLSRGAGEEIEALRVPIALALVKLLQVLPERTLHTHLPGILLKICNCLKSRSKETRDVARETLIKMTQSLGPKYVPYVVKEMKDTLTKGYQLMYLSRSLHAPPPRPAPVQLHVLSYSLHALLCDLSKHLASGDLDSCLQAITDIVTEDLFGQLAEEREVPEAVSKLPEAKSSKGLATLEIVSSKLSPQLLPSLIAPLKKAVEGRPRAKLSRQVEEALSRVSLGVQDNEGFSTDHLLLFIHGLVSDSVPQLSSSEGRGGVEGSEQLTGPSRATSRENNFLIPTEPPRGGPTPVTQSNIAAHLLTQFGLQLLHVSLKREKIVSSSPEHVAMLDPFVPLLATTIKSKHVLVLSATLRCLQWMLKFPLPSLSLHRASFTQELFSILGRHARRGAAGGTNQELVLTAFKTMTAVIRCCQEEDVSESQLQLLLVHIEEDMQDYQRQSTAFPLLKAILSRKLIVEEMHDVMMKVAQMAVISESDIIRTQSRHVLLQFLLDYPLGRKVYKYLGHLVSNLSYEVESGRLSVLDMCNSIFTKFPSRVLQKQASFFFVPLCSQLVNDPSPGCREVVAVTVKTLLGRLDTAKKSELLSYVFLWMKSQRLLQCQLAVQTLCLFVDVEGTGFSKKASQALPLLSCYLSPASQMEAGQGGGEEGTDEETQNGGEEVTQGREEEEEGESSAAMETDAAEGIMCNDRCPLVEPSLGADTEPPVAHDHLLFTTLTCLGKMLSACSALIRSPALQVSMNEIWERTEALLLHPHAWVRLASARLTGLLFAAYKPEELASGVNQGGEYLLELTTEKVSRLSTTFSKMLTARPLSAELGEQVVKNLVFLARVFHQLDMRGGEVEEGGTGVGGLLLGEVMARMDKLARQEAGYHPKESVKRVCVFKWVGAMAVFLGTDSLGCHLAPLLRPVYREYVDSRQMAGKELHNLAEEVVEILKGLAGREAFARAFAAVQKEVAEVRESRKRKKVLDAVVNPEVSARQKIKRNLQKREQRKRKYRKYKGMSK